MTVRDETAKTPGETGTRIPERPRHTWNSMSRSRGASLSAGRAKLAAKLVATAYRRLQ